MTLRIRFPKGRLVKRDRQTRSEMLQAATSLLAPACLMAYVLAFWRLAADVGLAADSGVRGIASHWQLWVVLGVILQVASRSLHRKAALSHQVADRVQ